MEDLNCVFEGLDGKGAIYISTIQAAKNIPLLKKHNIKAVLSIARGAQINFQREQIPIYLYLPADDHEAYDLSKYFPQTYHFIQKARKQTNILIHCVAGISRSATVTAAYLIKKFQYSLERVLKHLQRKRTKIDPNPGFMKQLSELEKQMVVDKKEKEMMLAEKLKKRQQSKSKSSEKIMENKSMSPVKPYHNVALRPTAPSSPSSLEKHPFIEKYTPKIILKKVPLIRKQTLDNQKQEKVFLEKRGASIECKIERIKCSLKVLKKPVGQEDVPECPSPCKVYSPLLYKNRMKISFTDFEGNYFH